TATFTAGTAGSFTVTATGDPTPTFSMSGAPAWLSLDSTTGALTGTPPPNLGAGPDTFNFSIIASNGFRPDATQNFTLTVRQPIIATGADAGGGPNVS